MLERRGCRKNGIIVDEEPWEVVKHSTRLDSEKINSYVTVYKFMMRILCAERVNKSLAIYPLLVIADLSFS